MGQKELGPKELVLNPFAVKEDEVERGFAPHFNIEPIAAETGLPAYLIRRHSE